MFVVRPVESSDIPALEALAADVTSVVPTLPRTRKAIERAVERSSSSFAAELDARSDGFYFFVLESVHESTADRTIAGTAAMSARAGSNGTYFAFRDGAIQQVSRDLNISHSVHALTLCSDLTSYTQLSGFYLSKTAHVEQEAALLSRARLLFAAVAPQRFGEKFFASLAGITDSNGRSPFWEALGRKFFQMDFLEAERAVEGTRNRTLIVELMPHYPVYVPLLPREAQAAMARVHPECELPFQILADEGFASDEYLDIFDGGPILQARKRALRSFSTSLLRSVASDDNREAAGGEAFLVATAREEDFRAALVRCASPELSETMSLPTGAMRRLNVVSGDPVLCVSL
jgi:arginine N-succinyltransferase